MGWIAGTQSTSGMHVYRVTDVDTCVIRSMYETLVTLNCEEKDI